jgi:hypothetical protein
MIFLILLFIPSDELDNYNNVIYENRVELVSKFIELEAMDEKESKYYFTRKDDCYKDFARFRQIYLDVKDMPPVSDCMRFPPKEFANEALAFNNKFQNNIKEEARLYSHKIKFYLNVLKEAQELYSVYEAVKQANSEFYYVHVRRKSLAKLKELIGDEAYYKGELPPCVPTWRFRELK